jgi:hypothetical protein
MAGLTATQRKLNETIVRSLRSAGWERTDRGEAFNLADLTFDNGQMLQYLGYVTRRNALVLELTDDATKKGVRLFIRCGKDVTKLLEVLTAWQARVGPRNFREMIDDVARACPDTYRMQGVDGEVLNKVEPKDPSPAE